MGELCPARFLVAGDEVTLASMMNREDPMLAWKPTYRVLSVSDVNESAWVYVKLEALKWDHKRDIGDVFTMTYTSDDLFYLFNFDRDIETPARTELEAIRDQP